MADPIPVVVERGPTVRRFTETVVLASYPRSGNSMLRACLETATGVVTGSDVKPSRGLSRQLAAAGFLGEGKCSEVPYPLPSTALQNRQFSFL